MGPNLIALAIPFFFLFIGVELAVAWKLRRKVYRLADALCDMGCGIAQQTGVLLYAGLLVSANGWLYTHARWVTLPAWGQWVLAFVGVDFLYYWWHRLSHETNLLWAAHVVHHQSEDYNLAVALRQSVTTTATLFPFYVWLGLLGVPPLQLAVSTSLSTLYQFWIHTELVPRLPWFDRLFNSPSAHRVHHAVNLKYLDKNHAATLMVWDHLFGTYQTEEEPPVYGITRPVQSFNPVWSQLAGYADLLALVRKAPTGWLKVQVLFRSPAWRPEWMGEPHAAPQTREAQVKHDVQPTRAAKLYATCWFVLVALGTFSLLMWGRGLEGLPLLAVVASFYFTLVCIAGVLENRRWVRVLEPIRWAGLAALVPLLVWVR
ncbi:MAG: sterol desaturase family protein [Archangiaceae bacterium]|nr:sterol desaturase family protein [Archangiaceae bacterium]